MLWVFIATSLRPPATYTHEHVHTCTHTHTSNTYLEIFQSLLQLSGPHFSPLVRRLKRTKKFSSCAPPTAIIVSHCLASLMIHRNHSAFPCLTLIKSKRIKQFFRIIEGEEENINHSICWSNIHILINVISCLHCGLCLGSSSVFSHEICASSTKQK